MIQRMLLLALGAVPVAVHAQDRQVAQYFCAQAAQPDYGFDTIDCVSCEVTARGQSWIVFHRPPVVRGVRSDGPAAGLLVDGDTLVAIDGIVITTPQGARRYASLVAGDTVEFRVRRGSGMVTVRVPVATQCGGLGGKFTWFARPSAVEFERYFGQFDSARRKVWPDSPVVWFTRDSVRWKVAGMHLTHTPVKFSYTLTPTFRRRTLGDSAVPTPGWIGIAMLRLLRTPDQLRAQDVAGAVFTELPEIAAVAPGSPADSAGIVAGDTLSAIDGISILTIEGTRRFLEAPIGVPLQLTVRRGGAVLRVRVVPRQPPAEPPAATRQPRE